MKVVCLDFDDVLTNKNTLKRLSKLFGNKLGELKYKAELLEDNRDPKRFFSDAKNLLMLAKGVPYDYVARIGRLIGLNKNGGKLLKELKSRGYKVVIVSINDEGLIRNFLEKNRIDTYIDNIYASKFVTKNGILTGEVKGESIRTEKVGVVKKMEKMYRVNRKDITYIGDGLTDLPIMKLVGRSILFCPNMITQAEVLEDRKLKAMKNNEKLFLVKDNDLKKVLEFIE